MCKIGIEQARAVLRDLESEEEAYDVENPVLTIVNQLRITAPRRDVQQ
jgi:hypothetical protein